MKNAQRNRPQAPPDRPLSVPRMPILPQVRRIRSKIYRFIYMVSVATRYTKAAPTVPLPLPPTKKTTLKHREPKIQFPTIIIYHYITQITHAFPTKTAAVSEASVKIAARKSKPIESFRFTFSLFGCFLFSHQFPLCRIPKKKAKKIKESFENPLPNR